MWRASGEDACQQAGLPAHRNNSNKAGPPSQGGHRPSRSYGAKRAPGPTIHGRWDFRRTISLTLIPVAAARRRPDGYPSPKRRISAVQRHILILKVIVDRWHRKSSR
jgi:hypothetical protein